MISKHLKTNDKEKLLKETRDKRHILYRGIKIKITANFL